MQIDIVNTENKKVGTADLSPAVFEAVAKPHLVHDVVVAQLATRRAGTHSTKTRAFVSGGGVKPWKQKGTGRARAGSIRSPLFRGGAILFGPTPRTYGHKPPKKVRRQALTSVLSAKAAEGALTVVDGFGFAAPRTRDAVAVLAALGLAGKKVLLVMHEANETVEKSFRNIAGVTLLRSEGVNVYDLLRHEAVLATKEAVGLLNERLA